MFVPAAWAPEAASPGAAVGCALLGRTCTAALLSPERFLWLLLRWSALGPEAETLRNTKVVRTGTTGSHKLDLQGGGRLTHALRGHHAGNLRGGGPEGTEGLWAGCSGPDGVRHVLEICNETQDGSMK